MHVCICVYHGYTDHLVVDGSTSDFTHTLALTQRVANDHFNKPTGSAFANYNTLIQCWLNDIVATQRVQQIHYAGRDGGHMPRRRGV